jgi:hypothetical protein
MRILAALGVVAAIARTCKSAWMAAIEVERGTSRACPLGARRSAQSREVRTHFFSRLSTNLA